MQLFELRLFPRFSTNKSGFLNFLCLFMVLFSVFLNPFALKSQESRFQIHRDEPGWPLDFFSPISGTFGEYRNHNMHMGADFKSYGLNGHPVLAVFDGSIDHISQSQKGYGTSFNLYSNELSMKSKYAHLYSFQGSNSKLELLRQALCLLIGKDEFYINLPKGMFEVKKGDWIGLTGESGSGISHLHLEFRDDKGFINPLFFTSFHQKDNIAPTILKLLWEDSARSQVLELQTKQIGPGQYSIQEPIVARGKIRIKLGGYDFIRSRNKNNVYAIELINGTDKLYRKEFFYVPYSDSSNKQLFYDINRSSLSPPVYFYNVFDPSKGYSIDLTDHEIGDKILLTAILEDATGNRSELPIQIEVGIPRKDTTIRPVPNSKVGDIYTTSDKVVSLDFKKTSTYGNGYPLISKTDWEKEGVKIAKGLTPVSDPYKISVMNFNWKGEATGFIKTKNPPTSKESLYFYDTSIKRFNGISSTRTKDGFQFKTEKLGILGVFADEAPPSVHYAYSYAKEIHLENARTPGISERLYYLGDVGSGFTTTPEVLLEGEVYPFEYDKDRRAISIKIPDKAFLEKKYLLLQIRPKDWAGNQGNYFTEILTP
ncbi:M23 family metallopeptidase [Leptospira sp. GIMC2001]|uniref:M23 family metallopeptidase n=1 Tax=Leptospira sp. GIMC2001 TaxID=1513297 RepID=UPI0023499F79|nr:M23 family metallopeptidase [Leptospira sp. GIMC2001]WCL48648.1 M23 family metallopeptidase [Leptospira sp. GIMC2001]